MMQNLRRANNELVDELAKAQTCAKDSLQKVHHLRQQAEDQSVARAAADTRVVELHSKVHAWKQRRALRANLAVKDS